MIKHCVLLAVAGEKELAVVEEAMVILEALVDKVPGMLDFVHGPNRDYERKSEGYTYGFVTTFTNRDAHLTYENHPEHKRGGGMLVASCKGGLDGIFVADIES